VTVPVPITGDTSDIEGTTTSSSTIPAPDTTPVEIFYTLGFSDDMQRLRRDLLVPVPIRNVIDLLESPTDVAAFNLRTAVRPRLIEDVVLDRATATVELDPDLLDRMSNTEQQRAVAQIVLTLTSFVTPDEGAIGFVRFEVDGDGYAVFVPRLGGSSDPGEPLAFSDFASLVVSTSLTPTTTVPSTTTTTTTTTRPAEPTPDST
jgi:hypothetical protein